MTKLQVAGPLDTSQLYEVRSAGGKGDGLYALRDIPKGTYLGRYSGALLPEMGEADVAICIGYLTAYGFGEDMTIDPEDEVWGRGNVLHKGNFSHEPNMMLDEDSFGYPYMKAIRNINKGDELTYWYGIEFPPVPYIQHKWKCLCGSKKCWGDMLEWRPNNEKPEQWEAEWAEIRKSAIKLTKFLIAHGPQNGLQRRLMLRMAVDDLEWLPQSLHEAVRTWS